MRAWSTTEVRLRRAREVVDEATMAKAEGWLENAQRQNALYEPPTLEDAGRADAILFGTPAIFGAMATELKTFLDRLGSQWKRGALAGKVGGAFATASWPHGASEVVTLSLYAPMAHLGMVIVQTATPTRRCWRPARPTGRQPSSVRRTAPPRPEDLDAARHQTRHMVAIAAALVAATEMPSRRPDSRDN